MKRRSLLLTAAAFAAVRRPVFAQSTAPMHVIGPPNDGYKTVEYAIQAGLYRKYGLTVEAAVIHSGAAAAAALIGGSADVAFTNITVLVLTHNKDIPMQILAPGGVINSDAKAVSGIIALKDAPIRSGRDLNGKVVGAVALGDTMEASIKAWIDQTGGDSRTVKFIEVPASAVMQMLQEDRVSAAGLNEPAITQALETGNARMIANPHKAIAKKFLAGVFAVMGPLAEQRPDEMRRFAQAMHESSVYVDAHLDQTVELVSGYSGIAPGIVARSGRVIDAEYAEPALIQPVIDVLVKYGVTNRSFPARDIISTYALAPPRRTRS